MRRTALITRACGGIGQETARVMARAGWDIAVQYDWNRGGAELTARGVTEAGGKALILQADLSDPASAQRICDDYGAVFGRLDALINVTGGVGTARRGDDANPGGLNGAFTANLTSPFLLAGLAARKMSTRHNGFGGVIVNVSLFVVTGGSNEVFADPPVDDAGLEVLTGMLARDVAADGVRVVSVRAGDCADTGCPPRSPHPDTDLAPEQFDRLHDVARAILQIVSADRQRNPGAVLKIAV